MCASTPCRFGVTDLSNVLCDPWSVHASPVAARIIQCFMYLRLRPEGNQYSHPIDMTPIVDMSKGKVIRIDLPYKEAPVEWNKEVRARTRVCELQRASAYPLPHHRFASFPRALALAPPRPSASPPPTR